MLPNPKKVWVDDNFSLFVEFEDGNIRKISIKTFLLSNNKDCQRVKTDLETFKKAYIADGGAEITWSNLLVSLDPDGIYEEGEKILSHPVAASYLEKIKKYKKIP